MRQSKGPKIGISPIFGPLWIFKFVSIEHTDVHNHAHGTTLGLMGLRFQLFTLIASVLPLVNT